MMTQVDSLFIELIFKIFYSLIKFVKCPMIKELAWDTSSTENFWLDVHSYKDLVGNFPSELFSLGVLKMFLAVDIYDSVGT